MAEYFAPVIFALLVTVIAFYCFGWSISNDNFRSELILKLQDASKVVETTYGFVEYCVKGEAPYILVLHGTPGMHDGMLGYYDYWLEMGFGVIAPSRSGYGRTEKKDSYAEGAD